MQTSRSQTPDPAPEGEPELPAVAESGPDDARDPAGPLPDDWDEGWLPAWVGAGDADPPLPVPDAEAGADGEVEDLLAADLRTVDRLAADLLARADLQPTEPEPEPSIAPVGEVPVEEDLPVVEDPPAVTRPVPHQRRSTWLLVPLALLALGVVIGGYIWAMSAARPAPAAAVHDSSEDAHSAVPSRSTAPGSSFTPPADGVSRTAAATPSRTVAASGAAEATVLAAAQPTGPVVIGPSPSAAVTPPAPRPQSTTAQTTAAQTTAARGTAAQGTATQGTAAPTGTPSSTPPTTPPTTSDGGDDPATAPTDDAPSPCSTGDDPATGSTASTGSPPASDAPDGSDGQGDAGSAAGPETADETTAPPSDDPLDCGADPAA